MEDIALTTYELVCVHVLPAARSTINGTVLSIVVTEHIAGVIADIDVGNSHVIEWCEEIPFVSIHSKLGRSTISGHRFTGVQQTTRICFIDKDIELSH